jgi:hypothetical protein
MSAPDERPRVQTHGHEMGGDTTMVDQAYTKVHCCDCWRYTDDVNSTARLQDDLMRSACTVLAHADKLSVEKSEAFAAADAYLADVFKAAKVKLAGPSLSMPKFGS